MPIKTLGTILIVAGVLVIAFILISPVLGIGNHNIFSLKKLAVAIFGLIAVITGIMLSLQKKPAS
ncbi:MAG: hypothetical protein P4L50_01200 [Anaerolineaceae bacterium]|nr:hypothetical protein [Anaerolineaceae bacterium]